MTPISEHDIAQLMTAATEGLAGHPDPGPSALAGLHRRRQRRTAAGMVAVAVSALAVLAVTSTAPRPSPGALTSAPTADRVRSSPYWRVRFTNTVQVPGRRDDVVTFEQWLGHGHLGPRFRIAGGSGERDRSGSVADRGWRSCRAGRAPGLSLRVPRGAPCGPPGPCSGARGGGPPGVEQLAEVVAGQVEPVLVVGVGLPA